MLNCQLLSLSLRCFCLVLQNNLIVIVSLFLLSVLYYIVTSLSLSLRFFFQFEATQSLVAIVTQFLLSVLRNRVTLLSLSLQFVAKRSFWSFCCYWSPLLLSVWFYTVTLVVTVTPLVMSVWWQTVTFLSLSVRFFCQFGGTHSVFYTVTPLFLSVWWYTVTLLSLTLRCFCQFGGTQSLCCHCQSRASVSLVLHIQFVYTVGTVCIT